MVGAFERDRFVRTFRDRYVARDDIRFIKSVGFNTVRIPLHYALFMTDDGTIQGDGWALLDRVLGWVREAGLYAIVDLHADTLLWSRDLLSRAGRGQVDLPRLQEGNVALQVFSSVTKTPRGQNYDSNGDDSDNITPLVIAQLQPVRTWGSLLNRSLWHATKLRRAARASNGELRLLEGDLFTS